jgi:hypothetical protein
VTFVIIVGIGYVHTTYWFGIPEEARKHPQQIAIPTAAAAHANAEFALARAAKAWGDDFTAAEGPVKSVSVEMASSTKKLVPDPKLAAMPDPLDKRSEQIRNQTLALYFTRKAAEYPDSSYWQDIKQQHQSELPQTDKDREVAEAVLKKAGEAGHEVATEKWGMLGEIGINQSLQKVDDATRSNFMPYGLSGVMLGAALVFFAFIGFDSISTHSEEAIKPSRDVPIGIIASLTLCTILYVLVAGVITGMVPYPEIDTNAAVASAFTNQKEGGPLLKAAGALIAAGALAGMTSVLLITFLSQSRIFLAMARDGLLPQNIFGAVHEKFRTPHLSTMITGSLMMVVAAFTPILKLEEMVNIGTLFAFVVVCAAVLILRIKRPEAHRPFRCPAAFVVAPLGIAVNLTLMFFLPTATWERLVYWLLLGLVIYFSFGVRFSALRNRAAPHVERDGELTPAAMK